MNGDDFVRAQQSKRKNVPRRKHRFGLTGQYANPGKGIRYEIDGDDLVMRINLLQDFGWSKLHKTKAVAHTAGPVAIAALPCAKGKDLPYGLMLIASLSRFPREEEV